MAALGPRPRLGSTRLGPCRSSTASTRPSASSPGTVGEPGQRTFFLQARAGARVTSVALEKQQVQILAERVAELLDELIAGRRRARPPIPAMTPVGLIDNEPLEQPIEEEFRAGTITLSWDADRRARGDRGVPGRRGRGGAPVEAAEQELIDLPIEEPEPEEVLAGADAGRAWPGRSHARAESVVAAGRAPCPFCGGPIDPDGHLCPRANGFRRTHG